LLLLAQLHSLSSQTNDEGHMRLMLAGHQELLGVSASWMFQGESMT